MRLRFSSVALVTVYGLGTGDSRSAWVAAAIKTLSSMTRKIPKPSRHLPGEPILESCYGGRTFVLSDVVRDKWLPAVTVRICPEPIGAGLGGNVYKGVISDKFDRRLREVVVKFNLKTVTDAFTHEGSETRGSVLMESEIEATKTLSGGFFVRYRGRVDAGSNPAPLSLYREDADGKRHELTYPGLVIDRIRGEILQPTALSQIPSQELRAQLNCFTAQILLAFKKELEKGVFSLDMHMGNVMVPAPWYDRRVHFNGSSCPQLKFIDLGRTKKIADMYPADVAERLLWRILVGPAYAVAQVDALQCPGLFSEELLRLIAEALTPIKQETVKVFSAVLDSYQKIPDAIPEPKACGQEASRAVAEIIHILNR